ncbi:MAG: hypothetical protein AAFV53_20345 [Myxococcota bacterium]
MNMRWIGKTLTAAVIISAVSAVSWDAYIPHGTLSTMAETLQHPGIEPFSDAEIDDLIAAQRHLRSLPAFVPMTRERDAGVLLNPIMRLDGPGPEPTGPLPLWADPDVRFSGLNDWRHTPESMPPCDLSITRALLDYDHWDQSASGPYAAAIDDLEPVMTAVAPVPSTASLRTLVKLRLARGLVDGNMLEALVEVRHLTRLMLSTDSFITAHVGVAMLNIERQGYEEAVARGLLEAGAWAPVSSADTGLARRMLFAMHAVYVGDAPADALDRLNDAMDAPFGTCPALSEAIASITLIRGLLEAPLPFEGDFNDRAAFLEAQLTQTDCPLRMERKLWAHPEWNAFGFWDAFSGERFQGTPDWQLKIPGYRVKRIDTLRWSGVSSWRSAESP